MFALPGIILLLIVDYLKPQEVFPILMRLPLLYIFTGLALLGFAVDLRLGLSRLRPAPQLAWVIVFLFWCLVTAAIQSPDRLQQRAMFVIQLSLFVIVGHAVQTFRAFQVTVFAIFAIGLFLAVLGVHQGLAPKGCHYVVLGRGDTTLRFDGRECETVATCWSEGAEPGYDYSCEHPGMLNTSSVGGRVRYRGTLADPNELSLAVAIVIPFAFAYFDRRRNGGTAVLLVATCILGALCGIFTKSRGGQLVFLAVLGVYFLRRAGVKGLMAGLVLALPVLLFGGRSGAEGESSTMQRLEAWSAGWEMFRNSPLVGAGFGNFTEHHYLTAHSSYVLTAAELGLPGMFLFTVILYLSLKTAVMAMWRRDVPPVVTTWSVSMVAAMVGMIVGIGLLSFAYKEQLWIYIGLCGALYQCIKRHDPAFEVGFSAREAAIIFGADVAFIFVTRVYVLYKGV